MHEIKSPLILQPGPAALTDGLAALQAIIGNAYRSRGAIRTGLAPRNERRRYAVTSAAVALDFLAGQLADVEVGWSLGTFGAIAEFTRDADETVALDRSDDAVSAVTARGGICIKTRADLRAIASESLTPSAWNQRVALCLPEAACAMSARTVLTEVGLDGNALRADDRSASLFDLGLGAMQIDACVRSADPEVDAGVARLRGKIGFRCRK